MRTCTCVHKLRKAFSGTHYHCEGSSRTCPSSHCECGRVAPHAPSPCKASTAKSDCCTCYYCTWTLCAGFQWDYVFDWTILKYQQTKNHAMGRPEATPAAQADPADTDKGDRSGFARASRGDSGRRCVHQPTYHFHDKYKHTICKSEAVGSGLYAWQMRLSPHNPVIRACCHGFSYCVRSRPIISYLGTG